MTYAANEAMKPLFTLLTLTLLSIGATACGSTGKGAGSGLRFPSTVATTTGASATQTSRSMPARPNLAGRDRDEDSDSSGHGYYDRDDDLVLRYGHAASAGEQQAITTLIRRYYAAAAAGDGAQACTLIYSLFAESIPEDYGQPPAGPPSLRGKTCAAVMSKLFKQQRRQLASESATLKVLGVRLEGNRGQALLSFGAFTPRQLPLHRERGTWKIFALLDSKLP